MRIRNILKDMASKIKSLMPTIAVNDSSVLTSTSIVNYPTLLIGTDIEHRTYYYKKGSKVYVNYYFNNIATGSTSRKVFELPQGYRPLKNVYGMGLASSWSGHSAIAVTTDGSFYVGYNTDTSVMGYIEFDAFS